MTKPDLNSRNAANDSSVNASSEKTAYNQTILVYLLLLLHPIYGITALIGVIVCHMKQEVTQNTVFESHRRWQIWTFWTGAIGYAASFYYIVRMGSWTILMVTMVWMLYRIVFGWWKALNYTAVGTNTPAL